jgi:hypothetical protein
MAKPATLDGYSDQYTLDCERVLVTLLRGLGPWKDSVYLVGGLTPRYLVPARPPVVPAHAGTLDVDIVIDLQILADTEAYHTLEENLKRMGFERAENEQGGQALLALADPDRARRPDGAGAAGRRAADRRRARAAAADGRHDLGAQHPALVDRVRPVPGRRDPRRAARRERDGDRAREARRHRQLHLPEGIRVRPALRAQGRPRLGLLHRACPGGAGRRRAAFARALAGKHAAVVREALDILRRRFADDGATEGYRKDGPVSVAKFEQGEGDEADQREARVLRQRQASDAIQQLLVRAV